MDQDTIDRIHRHMAWSQSLGAPVRGIPGKSVELIGLIQPWLVANTTPREAGIVLAAVYLYFAGLLLRQDDNPDGDTRAHELLDTTRSIIADIEITDEEEE
jgi:hypothetical protein